MALSDDCGWDALTHQLGHTFQDGGLLQQALTHSTFANEQPQGTPSYERLEFLGDAVLQLLVSEHLYAAMPHAPEGELSRRRAQLVREPTLAALARTLGLDTCVRVGSGQRPPDVPASVLADVVEAVLAAVYLDGGLQAARNAFGPLWSTLAALGQQHIDYKTRLQEACHRLHFDAPCYEVTAVDGPAHARQFHLTLRVGPELTAQGVGTSKKAAEQLCARQALEALGLLQQS
jgi:ribonuclease-3